jgi:hypothetical protein
MKLKILEVYGAIVTFRNEGIIHIHYTSEDLNLSDAKNLIEEVRKGSPWDVSPILISADPFSEHDDEAQKFLAGEEVMKYCSAVGIITSNLAQKIAINFFIKIKKPSKPTRFFNTEKDALRWLNKFETIQFKIGEEENYEF